MNRQSTSNKDLMNYNTKFLGDIQLFTKNYWKYLNLNDDLVQEAIIRFLGSYKEGAGSNPISWFKACIDSCRSNHNRKNDAQKRISKNDTKFIEDDRELYMDESKLRYLGQENISQIEANECQIEKEDAIQAILELLPRVQRSVLTLLFQDYTIKEVANELDMSSRYVTQYRLDAIKNIKHKLSTRPELKSKIIRKLF